MILVRCIVLSVIAGVACVLHASHNDFSLDEVLTLLEQNDDIDLLSVSPETVLLWEKCYELIKKKYSQDVACDIDGLRLMLIHARSAKLAAVDVCTKVIECFQTRLPQCMLVGQSLEEYELTLQILYSMLIQKIRDSRAYHTQLCEKKYDFRFPLSQLSTTTLRALSAALDVVENAQCIVSRFALHVS